MTSVTSPQKGRIHHGGAERRKANVKGEVSHGFTRIRTDRNWARRQSQPRIARIARIVLGRAAKARSTTETPRHGEETGKGKEQIPRFARDDNKKCGHGFTRIGTDQFKTKNPTREALRHGDESGERQRQCKGTSKSNRKNNRAGEDGV
jgi:hypothetical protein